MFGLSKRERTEKELREIQTWIVGRSMVIATTLGGETTQTGESAFNGTDKQFAIAIEACCFFLHALSRIAWRPQGEHLRERALDPCVEALATAFTDMQKKVKDAAILDLVDLFNEREFEYGAAKSLIGDSHADHDSAVRLATTRIESAADRPREIQCLALMTELVASLNQMELGARVQRLEQLV